MKIQITKLVGKDYLDKACSFTANKEVHPKLKKLYLAEHSPIRTQIFWIEMIDIPTFVSTHLARHSVGISHFVKSNREDKLSYTGDKGRYQPVNHAMLINAQALINMARKRLCNSAHEETRRVMIEIKNLIKDLDPDLAECMVPECQYRGKCVEIKTCEKIFV